MPKIKKTLHSWGSVYEVEETYITHWVQLVGESVIRCDHDAKNKNWGAWTVCGPGNQSSSWIGSGVMAPNIDPKNWLLDEKSETFISEVDYS